MRITQIMLSKGFGGAERYFVDLSVALARAGHQVQALCHRDFVALDRLRGVDGLSVQAVMTRGMWDRWSLRRMVKAVRPFAPHIVHGQLSRGTWAGARVAAACGVPLVSNMHNYPNLAYYRRVHSFIAPTEDLRRYLLANGVPSSRVRHVPNFSSLDPSERPVEARYSGAPTFCAYGRFVKKKGFDLLLSALRGCLDGGLDARLVLGGDGPVREDLKRLARALGLGERVRFTGWIDDPSTLLRSADVFVLPSREEPFGIVVLEAMARGVPIVATRTRGPGEVLDEGIAWLVSVNDSGALQEAMREAAADRNARERRARAALERYRARYHASVVVPQVVELYRDLLAHGSIVDTANGAVR